MPTVEKRMNGVRVYSPSEFAALVGKPVRTIQYHLLSGRIRALGGPNGRLIPETELRRYMSPEAASNGD